jgi:perosamine synthetase
LDKIIDKRKACGTLFEAAVNGCSFLTPQYIPADYESSYYTFAVRYTGDTSHGVSWKNFYYRYKEMGGDGFYGACQVPYLEPALINKTIGNQTYKKGLCPIAEKTQRQIMQFKTNYRDLDIAKQKADILCQLIQKIKRG